MNDISKIIAKVQALLALSTSSNANEAAAAAAAANKLIDAYRLDLADLETQEGHQEPIEEDPDYIYQSGKITRWKQQLISTLTSHYGCAYWNDCHWDQGRQFSRYRLVGRRSDLGIVRYMYAYLSTECMRLSAMEAKGKGRIFVASYCEGFVSGVAMQLKVSRAQVQQQATSTAIIKIDAREQEATDRLHDMRPNLKTNKSYSYGQRDTLAYGMGQQRGKSVHLGASISSGTTKLLKG